MHKTKCAVLLVLIGSQIGIIPLAFNISSTLILEWKFVKVVEGKVGKRFSILAFVISQ